MFFPFFKLQEGESDNEFNFHEAETESDSDDNQSTQDAQRSVQTGATAGSDTGEESFFFFVFHLIDLCPVKFAIIFFFSFIIFLQIQITVSKFRILFFSNILQS